LKSTHRRFDYTRFGEAFLERGLIDAETLQHVLAQCQATRALLPEILVTENLVSDWEVSRVACELYHIPFLTVDLYEPNKEVLAEFDANFLRQFAMIPLDRYGDLLTVVMPGLVPSDVLEGLRLTPTMKMLPVVGSVLSNRRWLNEHIPGPVAQAASVVPPLPNDATLENLGGDSESDWLNIFDAGDEAVQLDLKGKQDPS
jgi:hypothetical protein